MKTFTFTLLILFLSINSFSQDGNKKDRIKALKTAFITQELDLSKEESEKFWTIYNAYDEKVFELRHQKLRAILDKCRPENMDKLSEKEASALLQQINAIEEELYVLRKKLINDLSLQITAKKIIKLKKAEDGFNRQLLKQVRERRR